MSKVTVINHDVVTGITTIKESTEMSADEADESSKLVTTGSKSEDGKTGPHHKHEPVLAVIEKICFLVIWPLDKVMPVNKCPEIALAFFFVIIYFLCEFTLTVFNVFSVYTGLSHFLVGLTLMVWGSDNLELINMTISVKNK